MSRYIYSDELIHGHKYIRKYRSKTSGKYVYVYERPSYTKRSKDIFGNETTTIVPAKKVYQRDSDNLFSSTKKSQIVNSKGSIVYEYRDVGKIDRGIKEAVTTIDKLSKSAINKGRAFIERYFK